MKLQTDNISTTWLLIFTSWLIASIATLASLFFSEIMELTPCILCWYQRIFMFPLSIMLFIALFPLDQHIIRYALPFTIIGISITFYHCLVFFNIIPESLQPCSQGVPCNDDSMILLGFLPIPILSLIAFISITILLLTARSRMSS